MNKLNINQFTQAFLRPIQHISVDRFDAYAADKEGRKIWIAINLKQQRIDDIFFQLPPNDIWAPYFNLIPPLLVGLTVEEAMLLSWHELFDQVNKMEPVSAEEQTVVQIFLKKFNDDLLPFSMLPAQLVRLALSEYLGIAYHPGNLPSKSVIGRSNEHLVCRCFGVSNKALEKYFQQHSQATLAQVSGDINAGAGCGHCHEDIELISAEFCPNPIEIHINDGRYIGECLAFGSQTPASVALLVHDYLEKKWPGTHIIRCAGRRLELAPHTSRYVAMVEAIEQIRLELADILGSRPFILIHQQH